MDEPFIYIWFCRDCKRKGKISDNSLSAGFLAMMQHDISSPDCEGLIRRATVEEIGRDKEIASFIDWDD